MAKNHLPFAIFYLLWEKLQRANTTFLAESHYHVQSIISLHISLEKGAGRVCRRLIPGNSHLQSSKETNDQIEGHLTRFEDREIVFLGA